MKYYAHYCYDDARWELFEEEAGKKDESINHYNLVELPEELVEKYRKHMSEFDEMSKQIQRLIYEQRCVACLKEVDFCSPAPLCEEHWKLWWYSGMFEENKELPEDATNEEKEYYNRIVERGEFLKIKDRRIVSRSFGLRKK